MTRDEYADYLASLPEWTVESDRELDREFIFKNFHAAVAFINAVAQLAEQEKHHPDILLHGWNKVKIVLTTHAIKGLSINDFILATKINVIHKHLPAA